MPNIFDKAVSGVAGMKEPTLGAVFSYGLRKDKTNQGVLTKYPKSKTSPHTLMGRLNFS